MHWAVVNGRPHLFHNLPLASQFLHRYQLTLLDDRGTTGSEQLAKGCCAPVPERESIASPTFCPPRHRLTRITRFSYRPADDNGCRYSSVLHCCRRSVWAIHLFGSPNCHTPRTKANPDCVTMPLEDNASAGS